MRPSGIIIMALASRQSADAAKPQNQHKPRMRFWDGGRVAKRKSTAGFERIHAQRDGRQSNWQVEAKIGPPEQVRVVARI